MQLAAAKNGAAYDRRNGSTDLDPRIAEMIGFHVRALTKSGSIRRRDAEDVGQELTLHVVQRMPRHDPTRAQQTTFASRILGNKIKDLLRRAHAKCRDVRREVSLDDLSSELRDSLLVTEDAVNQHDVVLDVRETVDQLPAGDQQLAAALCEYPLAKAARRTGMTRQRARSMRGRIRHHFEARGLVP